MHMGNLTKDFVPVGKEEQAEVRNEDNAHKVCSLYIHLKYNEEQKRRNYSLRYIN